MFTIFAISALIAAVSISIWLITAMYEFAQRTKSTFVDLLLTSSMTSYVLSFCTAVGTGMYLLIQKVMFFFQFL